MKTIDRLLKMVKSGGGTSVGSVMPHKCGSHCLGPLTFHSQAVGVMVHLSQGSRLAERRADTFRNGLVFSSRQVKVNERIHLRVLKDVSNWHGALRVGFTTVPPSDRSLPLPGMAIPDLTRSPGHWAAPVHELCCLTGSELEFWVSAHGSCYVSSKNSMRHKLLTGVDISRPLWAMIDIYGQTCSVFLLGSEQKSLLCTKRSCPSMDPLPPPHNTQSTLSPDVSRLSENSDDCISCFDMELPADTFCVVCMVREARITLPCGHRCLCKHCVSKVSQQFGVCPLCRHQISA
ncbi:E3 ubiquitin-protein ligase NEURL3 isoform X2 [Parambassis ranga]|uniref:E3 ubiquitin-protein ligase NEURL3 isoform X2 n=1 Tax=Parambassis ranga TaxID=210632 RepID=A0A6P7IY12_9TELE|nr:E3 ubiquitin-protein ligase NEURL3 isoform X2 [Parambassis ranga]